MNKWQKQRRKLYYRTRRANFLARGLTHDGKPRQRGTKHRYPDLDHLPARQRAVERVNRWRRRNIAKGLNARGKTRGIPGRRPRLSATYLAWQELRATMVIKVPEIHVLNSTRWED